MRISKSTLWTVAFAGLGVLLAAGIVVLTLWLLAGPKTVTVKAYVDGTDVVKLRGRELWIEHQAWVQPARITINGVKWNPVWNATQSPSFPNWTNNVSLPFVLNYSFRPRNPDRIQISKKNGRGTVAIAEMPTPDNQETLAIIMDDGPFAGADWYEFTVSW